MRSRNELINHMSSVIDDLYEFDTYSGYQSTLRLLEEDIRLLIESCKLNVNTNYDRVRNMSIDEIAVFMGECGHDFPPYCDYKKADTCDQNCLVCAKQWLSREI